MGLWYLSFAEPGKFLGAAFVEARGHTQALQQSHRLGINPGGEVELIQVPSHAVGELPPNYKNRLLSKAELEELDASMSAKAPN